MNHIFHFRTTISELMESKLTTKCKRICAEYLWNKTSRKQSRCSVFKLIIEYYQYYYYVWHKPVGWVVSANKKKNTFHKIIYRVSYTQKLMKNDSYQFPFYFMPKHINRMRKWIVFENVFRVREWFVENNLSSD